MVQVDTDMCFPWRSTLQAEVIAALLPSFGAEWHAILANGVCGWYLQPDMVPGEERPVGAGDVGVPPWTPGAVPVYCDLFALRNGHGGQHAAPHDVFLTPGDCSTPSQTRLGCRLVSRRRELRRAFAWGRCWC